MIQCLECRKDLELRKSFTFCQCEEDWTDGTPICQNCGLERKFIQQMRYELQCLLCGTHRNDLVVMQEHVMQVHNYTQRELAANTHRHERVNENEVIVYTMPDGKDWLKATRIE